MPRFGAFLRAINVGGHTVRMSDLKRSFEGLGFERVETYIASGNVVFDTDVTEEDKLERTIERALEAELGYPVETFVRSLEELAEVADRDAFDERPAAGDKRSVYVAFLGRRPTREAVDRLHAFATDDDTFAVVDREVYWLRRGGIGTSKFSGGLLEKTLGMPATLRGLPTIRKIVAKYGSA
jgi:uncharacterized protein (DUF1697 family)